MDEFSEASIARHRGRTTGRADDINAQMRLQPASQITTVVLACATLGCGRGSERHPGEPPATGIPNATTSSPASTAPAGVKLPPLEVTLDWPSPVNAAQLSPTSSAVSVEGIALVVGVVADTAPQTLEAYQQDSATSVIAHENEVASPTSDGWEATYDAASKHWAHVRRQLGGKRYFCEGATDSPAQQATLVRLCRALR